MESGKLQDQFFTEGKAKGISPGAIANLAGDFGNFFGRHPAHGAEKFRDHGGAFADDGEQVAGHLPATSDVSDFSIFAAEIARV